MFARIGALGRIEREAANELSFKCMRQLAGADDLFIEVAVEGDELVSRTIIDIAQFYFAEWRADGGHVHAIFVFLVAKLGDLALGELHHILDAAADIDKTKAVIL